MENPGRPHPHHHPHGISDLERRSSVTNAARLPALGRDSISAKPLLGQASPSLPTAQARPDRRPDLRHPARPGRRGPGLRHNGLVDADVVVIGAGALGLSTALHCAMAGRSVVVVERLTAGSQASGRAAGLFKSVQADELRTRLARRSIARAITFADWADVPLAVARSGSFLIARTAQHREYLGRELAQSRSWGADVREAAPAQLAEPASYYKPAGGDFALWCPEDVYIEEPAGLIRACLAARQRHGVVVAENEPVTGISVTAGQVTGVETSRRSITAPVVVDAAGGWVARSLGWPGPGCRWPRSATSC